MVRRYAPPVYGFAISLAIHLAIACLVYLFLPDSAPRNVREPVYLTVRLVRPEAIPRTPPSEPTSRRLVPETFVPRIEKPVVPLVPARKPRAEPPERVEVLVDAAPTRLEVPDLSVPPLPALAPRRPAALGHGSSGSTSRARSSLGSSRDPRGRAERLEQFGGTPGTENAVTRGLAWLAAHQDEDGKWDAEGFHRHCPGMRDCLGTGRAKFNVGVTALCSLAFLGAAHSPATDTAYRETIARGLAYLVDSQDEEGCFGRRNDNLFYNHALATFALAEAYGMTKDTGYKKAVYRALKFSEQYQQAGGGWDYTTEASGRDDLSITGWQVMAIRAAKQVGIPVPHPLLSRVTKYLDRVVERDGSARYADRGTASGRKGVNMVAVAMLARLYLGTPLEDARLANAAKWLERNPPDFERTYEWSRYFQSTYYWYTATLALFHYGGRPWDTWNWILKKVVLPAQSRRPHEEGSFDVDANWLGVSGGRITSTALMVLTLEIYYRYEPLHVYRKERKEG